ncbi:MAG: nuclear transport factor 2 family protein [Myxococcota bacterium]
MAGQGHYTHDELTRAFEAYNAARDRASETGDWSLWAAVFHEDARYIEHAYGEMHGREAIREWITGVMAPFPRMTFPQDWSVIDVPNGAVVFQCRNQLPPPYDSDGRPFGFPTWSRIVYAGGGLWASEEDVYNPARDAGRAIRAWRAAGGRFESPEVVKMESR